MLGLSKMKSVERFSSRVDDYIRYRPTYPSAIVDLLEEECGLTPQSVIADIGSGTGKLSQILLDNGNLVIGVEPNSGMREAAETILADYKTFQSVDGSAEATTLPDASVNFVLAGQAFHWFDPVKSKLECKRVLKPNGWVALIWNERRVETTPFLRAYEQLLLTFGTDYQEVRHDSGTALIEGFFAPNKPKTAQFFNFQKFDLAGLTGRLRSSSYTPEPSDPRFEPMITKLKNIFNEHQEAGWVQFEYDTRVFYERLQ
jgi:SAM-dependent methyltransferase